MITLQAIVLSLFGPALERLDAWIARNTVTTVYKGVSICRSELNLWCNDEFAPMLERALKLVEQSDPFRFARIRRVIRYVRPVGMSRIDGAHTVAIQEF